MRDARDKKRLTLPKGLFGQWFGYQEFA